MKKKKNKDSDYFDDCIVCRETKKAEEEGKSLGIEELKRIFRKTNKSN